MRRQATAGGSRRGSSRIDARRLAQERAAQRRRRVLVTILLGAAFMLVAIDVVHSGTDDPPTMTSVAAANRPGRGHARRHPHSAAPTPTVSPSPPAVSYPRRGTRRFRIAPGRSAVYGTSGNLARFQVAVEKDIDHLDLARFARRVTAILGDPQGWSAGGDWRFRRVGPASPHEFTLYLVTPATRDAMCHDVPEGYTSCRYGDKVMINVSRWEHGVPYYDSLDRYRDYAVSHEVGHWLGHGHELCPGKGRRAPTMQQQTISMHGCVPNPWPYPGGKRYTGPPGAYGDKIPTDPRSFYSG